MSTAESDFQLFLALIKLVLYRFNPCYTQTQSLIHRPSQNQQQA